MADAKITSKLSLDTEGWDRSLASVSRGLDSLQGKAGRTGQAVGGLGRSFTSVQGATSALGGGFASLLKGAGALGVGFLGLQGGLKTLEGVIFSTQSTGDAFTLMITSAKGAVDHLFQSIASGDWSNLLGGLSTAIDLAGEYSRAIDAAGDAQVGLGVAQSKAQLQLLRQKAIIEDPNSTEEERAAAQVRTQEIQRELITATEAASEKFSERLVATVRKAVGSNSTFDVRTLGEKDLEDYFARGLGTNQRYNAYIQERQRLEEKTKETTTHTTFTPYGAVSNQVKTDAARKAEQALETFTKKHQDLETLRIIDRNIVDEERGELEKYWRAKNQAEQFLVQEQIKAIKLDKRADQLTTPTTPKVKAPKAEVSFDEGSIGKAEQQLLELNKKLRTATTEGMRARLRLEIAELEDILHQLKTGRESERASYRRQTMDSDPKKPISRLHQSRVRDLTERIASPSPQIKDTALSSARDIMERLSKQRTKAARDEAAANDALGQSITGVGAALQGLSGIADDNAARMLQWMAGVLQAVGTAIPQIIALTAAQKSQAVAGAAASSSILGPIAVVASIASVVGALAAIPKFERGGIVSGSSYYGDKILARVNSGELIANEAQQRRIWQEMNTARGAATATSVSVGGEFRIRGGDLVVALERAERARRR